MPGDAEPTDASGTSGSRSGESNGRQPQPLAGAPTPTAQCDGFPPPDPDHARALASATRRSGDDVRHRGWFWHWNSIVTQYAPLIGLKGIGLLNSYTTWTDRREQSPYRGYAFPSQTAEAAFYGEDRAELITINKILVALDLIEIRKEMVRRTDEQGRNWRVPHNFYRVKDRSNGADLQYEDVVRIIELAASDAAVFRYLRRLFSAKFTPIDRDNPWHEILARLEQNPSWQELRGKVARREAKTSARSRAGHKKRAGKGDKQAKPSARDDTYTQLNNVQNKDYPFPDAEQAAHAESQSPATVEQINSGSGVDVDESNNGLCGAVEQSNNGSNGKGVGFADEVNNGASGTVEQSNSMYYQENTTTTTTSARPISEPGNAEEASSVATPDLAEGNQASIKAVAAQQTTDSKDLSRPVDNNEEGDAVGFRSGADQRSRPAPERSADPANERGELDGPGALVLSLFEAANDRSASRLERILLSELESDADPAARAAGSTGEEWVAAALREAVASGSSFVAPKRIRGIVTRWAAAGSGPEISAGPIDFSSELAGAAARDSGGQSMSNSMTRSAGLQESDRIWTAALRRLSRSLEPATFERLLTGSSVTSRRGDWFEVRVPSASAAGKLSTDYCPLVERALSRELGRPATVDFIVGEPEQTERPMADKAEIIAISAVEARQGRQLWQAVIERLSGSVPEGDLARLGNIVPLGQNDSGALVLGLPNHSSGRLLESQHRAVVERAILDTLGRPLTIALISPDGWTIAED